MVNKPKKSVKDYKIQGAKDIMEIVNSNICNINKKNHTALELYNEKTITKYLTSTQSMETTAYVLGVIHDNLIKKAFQEYYKLQEIRYADVHPSELQPDKSSAAQHEQQLQMEFENKD